MRRLIGCVLVMTLLAGCGKTVYVDSKGVEHEVDAETARIMAIRDADEARVIAISKAMESATAEGRGYLAVILAMRQAPQIERLRSWDERLLPWAQVFLPWVIMGLRTGDTSEGISITGDGNSVISRSSNASWTSAPQTTTTVSTLTGPSEPTTPVAGGEQ